MANSDKNIIITPFVNGVTQPNILFRGQGNDPITLRVLDGTTGTGLTAGGAISFEGSAGQLFSVVNRLGTGSIFSVNDISGIPSIDVDANGTIELAPFTGYVGIGLTAPTEKLHVLGNLRVSGNYIGNVVRTVNGITANVGLSAGTNITISQSGNTLTISSTGGGGGTGAVSSVTGSGSGISVSPTTGAVVVENTGVHSFNGLTGTVTGVTTGTANTFGPLQSFTTGISASGGTFGNDITVNGVRVGEGGGSVVGNVAVGQSALNSNTTGNQNTSVGYLSQATGATTSSNTSIGFFTLYLNTGNNNTAIGAAALDANTTGNNNTAVGYDSLGSNTTGSNNTSVGWNSLLVNSTGEKNVALGYRANPAGVTGSHNTSIGSESHELLNGGGSNVAIGSRSAVNLTTGSSNTSLGAFTFATLSSGNGNVAVGSGQAGAYNGPGESLTTGSGNILIGLTDVSAGNNANSIVIAGGTSKTTGDGSNTTVIGNSSTTSTRVFGTLSTNAGVCASSGSTFGGIVNCLAGMCVAAGITLSIAAGTRSHISQQGIRGAGFKIRNQVSFGFGSGDANEIDIGASGANITLAPTTNIVTIDTGLSTKTGDYQTGIRFLGYESMLGVPYNTLLIGGVGGGNTLYLPNGNGVLALSNDVVTRFNGLTGSVTGVTTGNANTFGPLQSFTNGISAAGGTLSGTQRFLNGATFNALANFIGGICSSGGTFSGTQTFVSGATFNALANFIGGICSSGGTFSGTQTFVSGATFNDRVVITSGFTNASPFTITANSLLDGIGAFRINGSEPDLNLNDTDGGFNTISFENAGVVRTAIGRNSSNEFYIAVRDPAVGGGAFKDNVIVANSSTGNVSMGYQLSVAGGISAAGGTFSGTQTFVNGATFSAIANFVGGLCASGGTFSGTQTFVNGATFSAIANFIGGLCASGGTFSNLGVTGDIIFHGALIGSTLGTAPKFFARAWVNFDASSGTPTIRRSGNVSSIGDNGVGLFTINFATAMGNTGYASLFGVKSDATSSRPLGFVRNTAYATAVTTTALQITTTVSGLAAGACADNEMVSVAIFN